MIPFDMRKFMEERARAAVSASSAAPAAPRPASEPIPVRAFREEGLRRAAELLREMRERKTILADAVRELVAAPEYSDIVPNFTVDPKRVFADKQDMCEYLLGVFSRNYVAANRNNRGLWTWLAFAYFDQFAKRTKNDAVKIVADERWIYDADVYRSARRHFVAGALCLYSDMVNASQKAKEMLFKCPANEFGGFMDAVTYKQEGTQAPVLLQVAAELYYDPKAKNRMKTGATDQNAPGTIRQLIRVIAQFGLTRDFYSVEDGVELLGMLPKQFNGFKMIA